MPVSKSLPLRRGCGVIAAVALGLFGFDGRSSAAPRSAPTKPSVAHPAAKTSEEDPPESLVPRATQASSAATSETVEAPLDAGTPDGPTENAAPSPARSASASAPDSSSADSAAEPVPTEIFTPRPVASVLELQIELHRRGFSCGAIDGVMGLQTRAALLAFQRSVELPKSGELDAATAQLLLLTAPAMTEHVVTAEELASLHAVPDTWVGKSEQENLGYATVLELTAERSRAAANFLRRQNPAIAWDATAVGTAIKVPAVERVVIGGAAPAKLAIHLAAHELEALDARGHVVAHFPVSIARAVEKRPVGELHVVVVIADPNYTFDPAVFPESAEGRTLGHKLIVPPGPNNPVGRAWIGLDRPGYGIHGTPDPENVGRTESHGCFRLANWDALTLLKIASVGMVVNVEP